MFDRCRRGRFQKFFTFSLSIFFSDSEISCSELLAQASICCFSSNRMSTGAFSSSSHEEDIDLFVLLPC